MYKKSLYNFINPLSDSESVRNFESCKNEECEKKKKNRRKEGVHRGDDDFILTGESQGEKKCLLGLLTTKVSTSTLLLPLLVCIQANSYRRKVRYFLYPHKKYIAFTLKLNCDLNMQR